MSRRAAALTAARAWVGTPYAHQASLRGVGCDCLGLIRGLWRDLIGSEPQAIPPYSADWGEVGRREVMLAALDGHLVRLPSGRSALPGDVLGFRMRPRAIVKHLAVLTDDGHLVHARERMGVIAEPLTPTWVRRCAAAWTWPEG